MYSRKRDNISKFIVGAHAPHILDRLFQQRQLMQRNRQRPSGVPAQPRIIAFHPDLHAFPLRMTLQLHLHAL